MSVTEILPIPTIEKDSTIRTAAQEMKRLDTGVLLVRDGNTITGLVTDRDIVVRALSELNTTLESPIGDFATKSMFSCKSTDSLEKAGAIMEENAVRYLLVMSPENEALGVLSLEVISAAPGSEKLVGEVIAATSRRPPTSAGPD